MSQPLDIVIVERSGELKSLSVKDFKVEELYKKCGFKKPENFVKQTEWKATLKDTYVVQVYAKTDGRANSENKYDFPPPIDTKLFYGNCALILTTNGKYSNLSIPLWNQIYEALFGGFEDLRDTRKEDEDDMDEDELKHVPKEKKTKQGYLKDQFVVSDSIGNSPATGSDNFSDNEDSCVGSELTEEAYTYDDKK